MEWIWLVSVDSGKRAEAAGGRQEEERRGKKKVD